MVTIFKRLDSTLALPSTQVRHILGSATRQWMITAMRSMVIYTTSRAMYMAMATEVHPLMKQTRHIILIVSPTYTAFPAIMRPMAHHIFPTTVGLSMLSTSPLIMKSTMVCTWEARQWDSEPMWRRYFRDIIVIHGTTAMMTLRTGPARTHISTATPMATAPMVTTEQQRGSHLLRYRRHTQRITRTV